MKDLERKSMEITAVMLSWALLLSLAVEELFRKYGMKALFTSGFGFGPIPINQGAALIIGTIILIIGACAVAFIDHKVCKLDK